MNKTKNYISRSIVYLIGMIILVIGVSISIQANLGVSPVSSIPYNMDLLFNIEMGQATIIFQVCLVILQIILLRKNFKIKNLLQIFAGILFGYLTTFSNMLVFPILPIQSNLIMQVVFMLISTVFIAVGVYLYVAADIVPLAAEGVIMAISQLTKKPFSTLKVFFDVSLVVIALIMSLSLTGGFGSIGIGTAVSAIVVGLEMKVISKVLGKPLEKILGKKAEK